PAAESAIASTERVLADTLTAADRGMEIASVVFEATVTVVDGAAELQRIVESFVALTRTAAPTLALPQGAVMLVAAALEHLTAGLEVLTRITTALADLTARMTALLADPAPAASGDSDGPGSADHPSAMSTMGGAGSAGV